MPRTPIKDEPRSKNYRRRKVARGLKGTNQIADGLKVLDVESHGRGTGPRSGGGHRQPMATVGLVGVTPRTGGGTVVNDPARAIGQRIADALDPGKAPGKVRTFADMTDEERQALTQQYSAPTPNHGRSIK